MKISFCLATLVWFSWVVDAAAQLDIFAIPGESTWREIKQRSVSENTFIELIELDRYEDGIGPIIPSRLVPVPDISLDLVPEQTDAEIDSIRLAFSYNVTRVDVVAPADVTLPDGTIIEEGTVLVPRWTPFPRGIEAIQLLRRAGITEIEAMINVAESFPRPP